MAGPVRERLGELSKGERVSLFRTLQPSPQTNSPHVTTACPKERANCKTLVASVASDAARYCEKCGEATEGRCQKCNGSVDAIYDYCLNCGNPISLTA